MPKSIHWFPSYEEVVFPVSWFVQLNSPLDWAWKTTPKWVLICLNPSIGSQVMGRFSSMTDDLYSWPYHWIGHGKLSQNEPSYALIHPLVPKLWGGLLPCQLICTVDLTIGFGMKNYPKKSPHMPEYVHWFPSYSEGKLNVPTLHLTFT